MKKWVILLAVASVGFGTLSLAETARSHDVLQTLPGVPNNIALGDNPIGVENKPASHPVTPTKKKRSAHPVRHRISKNHRHHLIHKKSHTRTVVVNHNAISLG